MKSNGPITDPCGTPLDIRAVSDIWLLISHVCDLISCMETSLTPID